MVYISIHAPQWGATPGSKPSVLSVIYFNPRTPVGCDSACHDRAVRAYGISIHAPQWGATMTTFALLEDYTFQSTHPSGVRPALRKVRWCVYRIFQSTHPSGVRHNTPFSGAITLSISIHAPQWGATSAFWYSTGGCAYFNPRTPVGCDASRSASRSSGSYFNPRTPVGCDRSASAYSVGDIKFQSTHPSGVRRRASTGSPDGQANFNPRTPVGCDGTLWYRHENGDKISIHAPQWGATCSSRLTVRL